VCDIEEIVITLEQARFIRFYSVQGKRYIKIVNFEKHQNPHKNEREAGSEIPDISESDEQNKENNDLQKDGTSPDLIGSTRADSLLLIPSSLIPDSLVLTPDSGFPSGAGAEKSAPPPNSTAPPEPEKPETALQTACRETWKAYGDAYFNRYDTEPVRNATVNTQVKAFVKRIGAEEAPQVAAFFVRNNAAFYVQRGHSFGNLLSDAEKIRTEWATGHSMTTTRARQIDRTQTNKSVVGEAMKILEGMNRGKVA